MKKLLLLTLSLSAISIYAQEYKGRVGINTEQPNATLEIAGNSEDATVVDGIIIPKLTGDELYFKNSIYTTAQKGALVYVTSPSDTSPTEKTRYVYEEGYYYFNGEYWEPLNPQFVKIGSGFGTKKRREISNISSVELNAIDFGFYSWPNRNSGAKGINSFVTGSNNDTKGMYSFVTGSMNVISENGVSSGVFGSQNTVKGYNAFVAGNGNTNTGNNTSVFGQRNTANSAYSFVAGYENTIKENSSYSAVFGNSNILNTEYSFITGSSNTITQGSRSTVFGRNNLVDNKYGANVVGGYDNKLYGGTSFAFGSGLNTKSPLSFNIGHNNEIETHYNPDATDPKNRLFVIGNGTREQRSNALTVWATGFHKWKMHNLNSYTSAVVNDWNFQMEKGMHSADTDGVLNTYDGEQWKKYVAVSFSSSAPANAKQGDMYFDTTQKKYFAYDGEEWKAMW